MESFENTRWSRVFKASGDNEKERIDALSELFEVYWKPLYWFARRSGWSAEDSADALQDLFLRITERNLLARADQKKGKLRTFLLVLLKRHLNDRLKHDRAHIHGGNADFISIDTEIGEQLLTSETGDSSEPLEIGFDRQWARTTFQCCFEKLKGEAGDSPHFAILAPLLSGESNIRISDLSAQSGVPENNLRVTLHRLRKQFRELLRKEVSESLLPGDDLKEEMHYLASVLRRESSPDP